MKIFKIFFVFFLVFECLCLNSFGQFKFKDKTFEVGVQGTSNFGGHGVCWRGRNIYVKNVGGRIANITNNFFIYYGNHFVDEANIRGVDDGYAIGTHGAEFAGPYLLSTTTFVNISPAHNHLYKDNGNGFFKDVTFMICPLQTKDMAPRGVAAGDFNGDNYLDFYFSNPLSLSNKEHLRKDPFPPRKLANFYIGEGNRFVNAYRGINWTGFIQGVACADMDGENGPDIIEAKYGAPTTIYLNDGKGWFHDAGEELGLSQMYDIKDTGASPGDFNNDAKMDLTIASDRERVIIYKNTGNREWGKLLKVHQVLIAPEGCGGFDVRWGDFNHDTWLDFFWNGVGVFENYEKNGERYFKRVESPQLLQVIKRVLEMNDARGAALGDPDEDGDLDVYATDKKGYNLLLINEINNSDWIQVTILEGDTGLISLGAKAYLYDSGHMGEEEFLRGYREIMGEYGYLGQDMAATVHFGAPSKNGARYDSRVRLGRRIWELRNIKPGKRIELDAGYTLTIECDDSGITDPCSGIHVYEEGTVVDVEAIANPGCAFCYWSGDINSKENLIRIVVDEDKKIKANFKSISPPLNFTAKRVENRSLFTCQYINVLKWKPNPENEGIEVRYGIYQLQNDKRWPFIRLEDVGADVFEYWIKRDPLNYPIKKNKKYEYAITTLSEDGNESLKVYATIGASGITENQKRKTISLRK